MQIGTIQDDCTQDGGELDTAKQWAEAALAAMLRYGVPPTPRNFTVWYAHAAGTAPELSRAIEALISHRQVFTSERCEELFLRFGETAHVGSAKQPAEQLQHTVDQILDYVEEAGSYARAYGRSLSRHSHRLHQRPSFEALPSIISDLIAETQTIAERNQMLEVQLSRSAGEIQALRQNLAAVRLAVMTDALTGIPNRKFFEERFHEAAHEAAESGAPLSLLFIDIDFFKRFNDAHGHQLGDQVLKLVARTLMDSVKGRDTIARYGGEEFVILLPRTRHSDALTVAGQIRTTVMARRIVSRASGEDYGSVTLSIGVATYRSGERLAETLHRADGALYSAKRGGRNRVVSEDKVPVLPEPVPDGAL
jgi:diguanylate cyclase